MNTQDLQELGLTRNESLVYRALLDLGPSHAGIISRKTGLHRRTVYDTTEMLIKKGLIGYILENNKRLFQASNPKKLLEIVKEKEKILNEALPEMNSLFLKTHEKEETNFYKGKEGLKTVFQDQLENNKEVLILGASNSAFEVLPFYFKWYDEDRKKRNIHVRLICSEKLDKTIPLCEIKYIPRKYANPLSINIYKDKTAIILWKKDPIAIVIKNKEITEGYKSYFEIMWKIAK